MKAFVPGLHETVYCWQNFVLKDEKKLRGDYKGYSDEFFL